MVISMEKRYDILGNEVNIGDDVIIIKPYYHSHVTGTIIKFTPKGFKVKYYKSSCGGFCEAFTGDVIKGKKKDND